MSAEDQPAMPRLDTPFLDPTSPSGVINIPWYHLLRALFLRSGRSASVPRAAVLQQASAGGAPLDVLDASTGKVIGVAALLGQKGAPGQSVVFGVSPQEFVAPMSGGTLVAFGCAVDIKRDADWLPVTLMGGAIPMMNGDRARLTWYSADKPKATFLPTYR